MMTMLRRLSDALVSWIAPNVRMFRSSRQPLLWLLAVAVGTAVALAAIVFREAIGLVQYPWLKTTSELVASAAAEQPWWVILAAPAIGKFMPLVPVIASAPRSIPGQESAMRNSSIPARLAANVLVSC